MPICKTELEVRLFKALKLITQYEPPERIRKLAWKEWGVSDGDEAVDMAYDNIQTLAKMAIKRVRLPAPPKETENG